MSLLIANVVPEGLVFAADRNLSSEGQVVGNAPKLVKWHDPPLVAGYVGIAEVDGSPMHEWLHGFFERHAHDALEAIGPQLADTLEDASRRLSQADRGTIVHVGGFEDSSEGPRPVIWYVRDAQIETDGSVRHLERFKARDELKQSGRRPPYFGGASGAEIRRILREADTPLPWAGFRQSFDLGVFGRLDQLLQQFEAELALGGHARATEHRAPATLAEWEPFVKMSVLCYAAYFEAFYPPGQQLVGGGVDVETIEWPA